jgi:hypothetical protein
MEDVIKLIGDEEIPGEIVENGEDIIDAFNGGNDGVLNRLVDAVNGYVTLDDKRASLSADDELEFNGIFTGKVSGVDTIAKTLVDGWTGKLYSLLIQGKNRRLFFDSSTKYEIQTIEMKDEKENVVAKEDVVAMMEKNEEGKWVANENVMEYCYDRLAKRFINK